MHIGNDLKMTNPTETAKAARLFLRQNQNGILSTLSVDCPDYPFGSVCPYMLNPEGVPVILISLIAQHTKNILRNNRVCLTVMEESKRHRLNGARVSLIGQAVKVTKTELPYTQDRFLRIFPEARSYFQAHDFVYFQIEPVRIRYIEGFAKIFWIEKEEFLLPKSSLPQVEHAIIEHMNQDHQDALLNYCRYYVRLTREHAQLISVDPDGFQVRTEIEDLYFHFPSPCFTLEAVRQAMVGMAKEANIKKQ